jgi:hypothetical protein
MKSWNFGMVADRSLAAKSKNGLLNLLLNLIWVDVDS